MKLLVPLATAAWLALAGAAALAAGANPTPARAPDPSWRNATPYVLSLKVFDQCLIVQSRLQKRTREDVHTACSCYARATVAQLNKTEIDELRANGYFNDSARDKAFANIDRCKLTRP